MLVREVIAEIEKTAPLRFQEKWDNCGLQIGDFDAPVSGVVCCLDVTEDVIAEAMRLGYNLVVSHHPLFFEPLKHLRGESVVERCAMRAIQGGINIYSAHTSLDNAPSGVNYRIAQVLGLENPEFLESADGQSGSGLVGNLPKPMPAADFAALVKERFGVDALLNNISDSLRVKEVRRVALCGGSGSFLIDRALAAGADCFITGEMSYHHWFDYTAEPLVLVLGHYQSEQYTCNLIHDILSSAFPLLNAVVTNVDTNPVKCL